MEKIVLINTIGKLVLIEKPSPYWFGSSTKIGSYNSIELTIEVKKNQNPSNVQINKVLLFSKKIDFILKKIFDFLSKKMNLENPSKFYYFSALSLNTNQLENNEWWITLEPTGLGNSKLNFLPRLTIKNDEIIWSNLA